MTAAKQPSELPRPMSVGGAPLLRGVNLTVDFEPWESMWSRWKWDDWVKWQVDRAVELDANAVRLIGNVSGITNGTFTLETYLDRWRQFLDYTGSLGLYAYPCGGDLAHWDATTDGQAQRIYRAWGALLDGYDHVIGIDVTNEGFGQGAAVGRVESSILATLSALTRALRDVTDKPLAHSHVLAEAGGWRSRHHEAVAAMSDHFDLHLYYQAALEDARPFFDNWAGRAVLLGEVGISLKHDAAAREARYEAAQQLVESRSEFTGALAWAVTDTSLDLNGACGLVDRSGDRRRDICDAFTRWPTERPT
ncbi:hypothetical protein ACI78Q_00010 [Geodermatophilus sp. SYSU D00705]